MKTNNIALIIITVVTIVAIGAFLYIYAQKSETQKQAINLAIENSCSDSAENFFMNWKSSSDMLAQTLLANNAVITHKNHFNKKLSECLIEINGGYSYPAVINNVQYQEEQDYVTIYDVNSKAWVAFMDLVSHRDRSNGIYKMVSDSVKCSFVSGQACNNVDDFSAQDDILMSQ